MKCNREYAGCLRRFRGLSSVFAVSGLVDLIAAVRQLLRYGRIETDIVQKRRKLYIKYEFRTPATVDNSIYSHVDEGGSKHKMIAR